MRVRLFQKETLTEDQMDIYYRKMTEQIETVLHIVKRDRPQLYGTEEGEKIILSIDQVYYIDTVDKKTFAYLKDKVYQIQGSLSFLEKSLEDHGFCRINKSNIVNIYRIHKVKSEVNMRMKVILDNQEELVISRYYRKIFHNYLTAIRGVLHE
ncbi:MAG: LytTR family DNA-binding domain-containing protein [Lachnospiraceae bacterium]